MHMKNIHKDILEKNDADLAQFVAEKRSELQKLRFGVAGSGMRNTHAIRDTRRQIAQSLTELTARAKKEHNQ
jgi:ribosomal protein L29